VSTVRPGEGPPLEDSAAPPRRFVGLFRGARPGHADEWDIEHADPDPKGRSSMLLALILVSVLLAASAQIVLKHGMNHVTHELQLSRGQDARFGLNAESLKAAAGTFWVWAGLALFGLSAFVWLSVLSRAALSFAYPFASLTYVVIMLYDTIRGEAVSGLRWGGVALIVAGIVLVSRTPSHS
jgi:drug/metabolite transporter (DMT)-like permease